MAQSLIDTMTADFEPEQFHDSYREALEALVKAKIEGNEVVRPLGQEDTQPGPGRAADLAETLRKSVEAAKAQQSQTSKTDSKSDSKATNSKASA